MGCEKGSQSSFFAVVAVAALSGLGAVVVVRHVLVPGLLDPCFVVCKFAYGSGRGGIAGRSWRVLKIFCLLCMRTK